MAVLPRRSRCCWSVTNTHGTKPAPEHLTVDPVHRAVALAAPTPAGIDDSSNLEPGAHRTWRANALRSVTGHFIGAFCTSSLSRRRAISHLRYRLLSFWLTLPITACAPSLIWTCSTRTNCELPWRRRRRFPPGWHRLLAIGR